MPLETGKLWSVDHWKRQRITEYDRTRHTNNPDAFKHVRAALDHLAYPSAKGTKLELGRVVDHPSDGHRGVWIALDLFG